MTVIFILTSNIKINRSFFFFPGKDFFPQVKINRREYDSPRKRSYPNQTSKYINISHEIIMQNTFGHPKKKGFFVFKMITYFHDPSCDHSLPMLLKHPVKSLLKLLFMSPDEEWWAWKKCKFSLTLSMSIQGNVFRFPMQKSLYLEQKRMDFLSSTLPIQISSYRKE